MTTLTPHELARLERIEAEDEPAEPIEADDDSEDGLPAYASERTRRLDWQGDYCEFAASLHADRLAWEREEYGIDEE